VTGTLTARQEEIVALIVMGFTTKAIAAKLGLSTNTVKAHVHSAMSRVGVRTRLKLVAWWCTERKS